MAARVHLDGDWETVPGQHGPVMAEDLLETRSRLFHVTYHWTHEQFNKTAARANYTSVGPAGTPMAGLPLVAVSAARDLGGGMCEFERTYAEVPRPRPFRELYPARYQFVDVGELSEVSLPARSLVTHTYYFTANPFTIPLASPVTAVKVGNEIVFDNGDLTAFLAQRDVPHLAEPETVDPEAWMGYIWRKTSRFIPPFAAELGS